MLRKSYGETGVMDFGLIRASRAVCLIAMIPFLFPSLLPKISSDEEKKRTVTQ